MAQTSSASRPQAPPAQTPPASSTAKPPSAAPGSVPAANLIENEGDTPEQKLAKRRERLELAAKRLRERAAEVRQQAAHPADNANSKRPPPANPEQQAQKLEEQAQKMEDRAKSMTLEDVTERSPEAARANRHRLRRAHINRRWGAATLHDPEAMAELRVHAERVAKLKRIQAVAREKSKEDPAIARARALLAREDDRHEQHMKAIQARVAPSAAANNTTATTAPEAK
ncbi:MAG TPA: hypothetical protein VG963_18040 [Polyangiaceae bacterium]|nr:hypothetical protein [Polyangiaceae bacterium]